MDAVVPLWIRWVPLVVALLYAPLLYFCLRGLTWFTLRAYRNRLRQTPDLHWTERARLSLAPRLLVTSVMLLAPFQGAFLAEASVGSLSLANENTVAWLTALGCFVGSYFALRDLGSTLKFKRSSFWKELGGTIFTLHGFVIVAAAVFGFWSLGDFIAQQLAEPQLAEPQLAQQLTERDAVEPRYARLVVALLAIVLLWGPAQTLFFRAVGLFRNDDALMTSLEPVFQTTGMRPRALWVVSTTWANALAYPLRKTIVITERLLELLSPAELAAIVAHELGHLKEGRKAWLRLGLLWFLSVAAFIYPFIEPDDHVVFLVAAFGSFFIGAAAMRPWARQREHDADSVAMQTSDAAVYARALEKLYEANLYPATQRGGTHASLYDRLERAGIKPVYPRPALPPRLLGLPAMVVAVVLVPVFAVGWPLLWQATAPEPALAAAVVTRRAYPLGELALSAWDDGNMPAAIALYRRAEEVDPSSPWYPRNLAAVLNQAGDCKTAAAAIERARANAGNDPEVATSLFTTECEEDGVAGGGAEP